MNSLGLFLLRLVVGGLYIFHGIPKLIGGTGTSEKVSEETKQKLGPGFAQSMEHGGVENLSGFLGSIGVPAPKAMAWVVGLTEALGGVLLILGWKTRPISAALSVVQVVAISKVHAPEGLSGSELNVSLLAGTSTLALTGPGKIAID